MKLLNIGFGNLVAAGRIIAVVAPDSAPVKRLVQEARDAGHLVDATAGRRTRAVLMMDDGHVVLSAVQPETIAGRMQSDTEEGKNK
ncbi:MAG: DUF370 domain-containing protein [Clostridia bacterium]|nr:DUF370 domain-containing protein [Clostridia bacterium]